MNFRKFVVPVGLAILFNAAYSSAGWMGVAAVGGGTVMWLLLHWTRMMQVLRRAADTPVGHVGSAVMLNAKLKPGATLLHVVAMTRSLGLLQSPPDTQPEVYRWTDGSGSPVPAEFQSGNLVQWTMFRPPEPTPAVEPAPQALPPAPPAAP